MPRSEDRTRVCFAIQSQLNVTQPVEVLCYHYTIRGLKIDASVQESNLDTYSDSESERKVHLETLYIWRPDGESNPDRWRDKPVF